MSNWQLSWIRHDIVNIFAIIVFMKSYPIQFNLNNELLENELTAIINKGIT